jgi:hypothetical protein
VTEPIATAQDDERIAKLQRIGRWLILAGVSVWGVWFVVKLTGGDPQVQYFLPFHLGGVIPGSILSRWRTIRRWFNRRG